MTIALKPCPAGHADARIYRDPGDQYIPVCGDRGCLWAIDQTFPSKEAAAEAWNTRAEPEEIAALRARVAGLEAALAAAFWSA